MNSSEQALRKEFVSSLIARFKLSADPFTQGHLLDLIAPIAINQFREFMMRLTALNAPYKDAFQKIHIVVLSFDDSSAMKHDDQLATQFYQRFYALYFRLSADKSFGTMDIISRFQSIDLKTVAFNGEVFNGLELAIIRQIGISDLARLVIFDKQLFLSRVAQAIHQIVTPSTLPSNR